MGIDWNGLKKEYESGSSTVAALANRFGCHRDSLRRKARQENWKRAEDKGSRRAGDRENAGLPDGHMNFWKGVERRLARGLKTKDVKQGLEELKVAKMAGEVLSHMIRSKRLEMGIGDGLVENGTEDPETAAREMARVTAPPGAEEAVD